MTDTLDIPAQEPASRWDALPDILTTDQLRDILQVRNKKTVAHLVEMGQLPRPVIRSGNVRRWRKEDVREFMERRAQMTR